MSAAHKLVTILLDSENNPMSKLTPEGRASRKRRADYLKRTLHIWRSMHREHPELRGIFKGYARDRRKKQEGKVVKT